MKTVSLKTKVVKTHDTYEAAFYVLWGGRYTGVRELPLPEKRASKKGYPVMWTITVENVPQWAIDTWRTGLAHGNINEFVNIRCKLKKQVKNEIRTK